MIPARWVVSWTRLPLVLNRAFGWNIDFWGAKIWGHFYGNNLSHIFGGSSNELEQKFPPAIILCLVHIQWNFGNRNPSNDLFYTPSHLRLWKIMFLLKLKMFTVHKDSIASTSLLIGCKQLYLGVFSWGWWRLPINHGDSSNYRNFSTNLKWLNHCIGEETCVRYSILWKNTINIHKHYIFITNTPSYFRGQISY